MTARKIITWPNEKLLKKAERIELFDAQTNQLAQDLYDTMLVSFGVGLAATQVDEQWSMCVIEKSCFSSVSHDPILKDCVVLVNPEIEFIGKERFTWTEACLSVPGISAEVMRHNMINLRYQDLTGEFREYCLSGTESATVQHESDHLVGKLFIDRLVDKRAKRSVIARLREMLNPLKPKIKKEVEEVEDQEDEKSMHYKKKVRIKRPKTFGKAKKRKKK